MTIQYTLRLLSTMLFFIPVYCLLRLLWHKKHPLQRSLPREFLLALFAVFLAAFTTLVLAPASGFQWSTLFQDFALRLKHGTGINLVPFRTIGRFRRLGYGDLSVLNLLGNVLIFAPIGFFPPLLWRRWQSPWKTALLGFACSFFIEFFQLFIARQTDVDDLILNTAGAVLGYAMFAVLRRIAPGVGRLAAPAGQKKSPV